MTCLAVRHGDRTAYWYGCRCPAARDAEAAAKRLHLKRRYLNRGPLSVPATGTCRRIRALQAMGWPLYGIDDQLGRLRGASANILYHSRDVFSVTADAYRALYERLCMTPGPSAQTAKRAKTAGWPPPLAWDDIDDPDCVPDYGTTDPVDVYRRIHMDDLEWLLDNGESVESIAERMGVSWRSLEKASDRAGRHDLARKVRVA